MSKTLSPEETQALLTRHPAWSLQQESLTRTFTFPTFAQSIAFVNQVAILAEKADHHPDIDIRYNKVTLALISHDVACLSPRDAAMVLKIEELPTEDA